MAPAGGIHGLGAAAEAVDRLGHKALAPDLAHRLDAFLAAAGALGDLGEFRIGGAELFLAEQRIALRQVAARQPDRGRGLPFVAEQLAHRGNRVDDARHQRRSEEHTSELQSLMRISYAVFCLKKKNQITTIYIIMIPL